MFARLIYVMDPMCSWCWGFAPVAEALAKQAADFGVPTHFVAGGLRSERTPIDAADRDRYLGYWAAVQERTGQHFDRERGLPSGMVYDTEPACRALVTVREVAPSQVFAFVKAVQQAFYVHGKDVSQTVELTRIAGELGIDSEAFCSRFDLDAMRETTRLDFAWARQLGISGFPTMLAERDGQLALLTNGYQPLEALAPLLNRWLERGANLSSGR
ncbi:DsbA family protein [Pseudomonas matsuisoli]|uniref:DsbA family protein n=1 Tax=Pseudomonas matsuisoli TaxID=1515666 RepID=A0A917PR42_9PSED|nr:DsbA family protein [Pseudomonas matsuisoli]GGJ88841.1 DsbA family protein [Pseudomonas matsuisoli]